MFRRTKIVSTLGPASESEEQLEKLIEAGVNVFRLNFSHGDHLNKLQLIERIRKVADEKASSVAILGDLQGPKIRTGMMKDGYVELASGSDVVITSRQVLGEGRIIPTSYENLPKDVRPGDQILLDDGLMDMEVLEIDGQDVRCRVITGGRLKDRKGINLPGTKVSAPALTAKDKEDLEFCVRHRVDFIALSFVRSAADVSTLKTLLATKDYAPLVVSKIEKPEAVQNFDAILELTDAVMVARGDLGVEMSPEKVPLIQKQIIQKCNAAGKPVITATQMLESMISNPRPTRAETSDVANAILDGTDAIMLSGETAAGGYPIEAVKVMDNIARNIENSEQYLGYQLSLSLDGQGMTESIGRGACEIAKNVKAAAILAFTQTGSTAALVSKYRPNLPIYAMTPNALVRRRMALCSGVRGICVENHETTEQQILAVEAVAIATGILKAGDVMVVTMGSPISKAGSTNLLKVHRLAIR